MNKGWIKIHRKILTSSYWREEPFTRGQAWIDMLLLANHQPGFTRKQGVRVELERGDLGWSETELAGRWQWSRGKVRRFLGELEKDAMILRKNGTETDRRKFAITILNYEKYQAVNQMNDTGDDTGDGPTTVQEQECKEGKKENLRKSAGENTRFAEFWKAYPRKKSKVDAQKAWKQVKGDSLFNEITIGLQRAITSPDWKKDGGKYIPYPASWLRDGGWMDETGTDSPADCKTCRHYSDQCRGRDETCSAYEVAA